MRNGDLANLVTELLGLGPVPGSELDAGQDLDWRRDDAEWSGVADAADVLRGTLLDELLPGADGGLGLPA